MGLQLKIQNAQVRLSRAWYIYYSLPSKISGKFLLLKKNLPKQQQKSTPSWEDHLKNSDTQIIYFCQLRQDQFIASHILSNTCMQTCFLGF